MSINASMELAFAGLRATQAGMDVVSQNVANAGSVGYTRRTLDVEQAVAGGRTYGVDVLGATRSLDGLLQRQLRLEQAGASYTSTRAATSSQLNAMFDRPGGSGSLASLINTFTSSLSTLANSPSVYGNRLSASTAASDLASTLNGLSDQVQSLRQTTENAIGTGVKKADDLLQQIQTLNPKIVSSPTAALQDQRDALIDQLSTLMDVKVTELPSGSVSITTTGGLQLFDGQTATRLSFDTHTLSAGASYNVDPTKRTVGTITATDGTGAKRDVLAAGMIRSGELAAQVELRDTTLLRASTQLDQLAAGLASALSDKTTAGTAATAGAATGFDLDLSSLSAGNSVTVKVSDPGGTIRTVTFVKATSAAGAAAANSSDGSIKGIDFSGGMASVATQIGAVLGANYAVTNPSGSTLRILDDGAAGTTDVQSVTGTSTVTTLASGGSELPLFVDGGRANVAYTGSFEGGSQLAGFASRITINPAVKNDPSSLVVYGTGVGASDATRPLYILDKLTNTNRTFAGAAGIGGSTAPFTGTVSDFAQRIIETQAADASSSATLNDGQQVVLNALQSRYADQSGVNVDTELTQLIQLQTAYSANARILNAAKEMMDMLLRIGS